MNKQNIIKSFFEKALDKYAAAYVNGVMMRKKEAPAFVMEDADNNPLVPHRALLIYSAKEAKQREVNCPPEKYYLDYMNLKAKSLEESAKKQAQKIRVLARRNVTIEEYKHFFN